MKEKKQFDPGFLGQGAVLLCAVLWSTSGLFIKLVDWHPVVITGLRSAIAALFMFGARFLFSSQPRPKNKAGPLWAGAIVYALTMITFVIANKLTTAANAIVLQYSAPVWAAILGWFLIREKPQRKHWVAMVCISAGFVLFFRDDLTAGALLGNFLALVSGVLFGAHSVLMRMQKDANPSDSMLLSHVLSFAIAIPFLIIFPPVLTSSRVLPVVFMGII